MTIDAARAALDVHVDLCDECERFERLEQESAIELCPLGQELFDRVVSLEEERLGVPALGEGDE